MTFAGARLVRELDQANWVEDYATALEPTGGPPQSISSHVFGKLIARLTKRVILQRAQPR